MSIQPEYDACSELCCDKCHFKEFLSHYDFKLHHLAHQSVPTVTLVRLSEYLLKKLKHKSYKLSRGISESPENHVSPLKISLKKHKDGKFQVVNNQNSNNYITGSKQEDCGEESKENEILKPRTESSVNVEVNLQKREVEGNNLLERLGANISITRKGSSLQNRKEAENELDLNENLNKEISNKLCQGKVLERLLSSGIPIGKQNKTRSKSDSSSKDITLPTIVNVFSTASKGDVKNDAKSSAEKEKHVRKYRSAKRIGGATSSLCPKNYDRDIHEKPTGNDSAEKENKIQKVQEGPDVEILLLSEKFPEDVNSGEVNKNLSDCNSPCEKEIAGVRKRVSKGSSISEETGVQEGLDKDKCNNNGTLVPKKHSRVKNSHLGKKRGEGERKNAKEEETGKAEVQESKRSPFSSTGTCGRTRKKLENCVEFESSPDQEKKEKDIPAVMGINSSPKEQLQPDFSSLRPDCGSPVTSHSETSSFGKVDEPNRSAMENNDCNVLGSPVQESENCESTTFNSLNRDEEYRSNSYVESANDAAGEGDESFQSLSNEDQSLDQQQQNHLSGTTSSSGESLNQNFLHNFLNESQPSQVNIQPEGSEFMSLERLGQVAGLESQSNYDRNSSDPTTPMEQLSQQVQRLPNPPQINVIPQHHMQAPQPPQLHAGLPPLSTQQSNSFDTLGHMQPPLPPPLYQGYNMYNQNFSSQGPPPLPPRPPLLQQHPQMQGRSFQGMPAPPRSRNRSYPVKRNAVRSTGPQDLPSKQRRVDSSASGRNQSSNLSPTAKIPSGITVTPPKKNLEATKVANVLASRGITVTPSHGAPRQTSQSNRSQQRSNPVINVGPGVSITPNSGRSSGNITVSRRNSPIVNPVVERPERCATVDLTLDDDPPLTNQSTRSSGVRFSCNQCTKVFSTSVALENHKASHRTAGALPFKCDKCTAQYPNASGLQQHKAVFHKTKQSAPELAIPIVDLNHPGARDQLAKCGVQGFLPLSQLQSNNLGYYGIPFIHIDSIKEKTLSNLSSLGTGNVLVLGKMKAL